MSGLVWVVLLQQQVHDFEQQTRLHVSHPHAAGMAQRELGARRAHQSHGRRLADEVILRARGSSGNWSRSSWLNVGQKRSCWASGATHRRINANVVGDDFTVVAGEADGAVIET